MIMKRN